MSECDPLGLLQRTVLDTFRVEEFVAEGGYGYVYRAFHKYFRSPIALKMLKAPPELSQEVEARFWEELRLEAEIQFGLSALTAHVVRPFHIGKVERSGQQALPVMALEWLEGTDLAAEASQRRKSGAAPPTLVELLDRLGGVAHAIHLSHSFERRGGDYSVVHRDIKPENLFVARVGGREIIKVLDFGTSKVGRMMNVMAERRDVEPTQSGFTPGYAAPEQWAPDSFGPCGPWTDVWGMALTLVELMKGDYVFSGNPWSVMLSCLDERRRPTPRNHGVDVSDEVEQVFERALAVDPRRRTPTIRRLWRELRLVADDCPSGIYPSIPAATLSRAPMATDSIPALEPIAIQDRDDSLLPFIATDSELPFVATDSAPTLRTNRRSMSGEFPRSSPRPEGATLRRTGTDDSICRDTVRDLPLSQE